MISNTPWVISESGISLLTNHFFATNGPDAYPVVNTNKEDVFMVEKELNKKAVLCPPSLSEILLRSAQGFPITEKLQAIRKKDAEEFYELTPEQTEVLRGVVLIAKRSIEESFSLKSISIVKFSETDKLFGLDPKNPKIYQISHQLLSLSVVHTRYNRCQTYKDSARCSCRETQILLAIIRAKASTQNNPYMKESYISMMTERVLQNALFICLSYGVSDDLLKENIQLKAHIQKLNGIIQQKASIT